MLELALTILRMPFEQLILASCGVPDDQLFEEIPYPEF